MMLSLFGSLVVVGWCYVFFLVHSLNLHDGNKGFFGVCGYAKDFKHKKPSTHNVMTMIKIVFVDVTVSVSSLMSLNFSRFNFTASFVCLMLLSIRVTA